MTQVNTAQKMDENVEGEITSPHPHHPTKPWLHAPWPKGVSPNPGGRPAGFQDVQNSARALGMQAIKRLGEILFDPKEKSTAVIRAAELILERGFGKAPAFKTADPQDFRDVLQLSDAQIRERLAAIRGLLIEHGIDPLTLPAPNGHGQSQASGGTNGDSTMSAGVSAKPEG